MTKKIELQHVHLMPQELKPGILYVSKEFGTAHHLCACGCGSKIRTPLGPTEWRLQETADGPTLWPSIGNWQQPCRSHYLIRRGRIEWAESWTQEQVLAGRAREARRRDQYYRVKDGINVPTKLWHRLRKLLGL